ncbi:hypothetical protein KKA27_02950 [Patescibacteria group bacterium]|nr:hypothetical protein [Patescibacteria group bacterium]MBU2633282.1 hypothetical protein [Patescibacteria group bacterium]
MRKKIVLIIGIVVVLCAVVYGTLYYFLPKIGDFCTMDVKLCPDGSYVGRTPPFCRFKDCPEVIDPTADLSADEAGWKTYRNEEYGSLAKNDSYTFVSVSSSSGPSDLDLDIASSVDQILSTFKFID